MYPFVTDGPNLAIVVSSTVVCTLVVIVIIAVVIIIIVKNKNNKTIKVKPADAYKVDEKSDDTMEQVVFGAPCVNHQFSKKHSLTIGMMSRPATASDVYLDTPLSSSPRDMAAVE